MPSREDLLREIPVLDKGHVRLVDFMGDDSAIVKAARTSYQNGTKSLREDAGLINYLMRNQHTSPFEMVEFVFDVKLPIFVARQIVRHRTASLNEVSGRYSVLPEEWYEPTGDRMQQQSSDNKQGSAEEKITHPERWLPNLKNQAHADFGLYKHLVHENVNLSRELARIVLPVSTYTQWIWKCDLHNLFNFLRLRLDEHAQWEVRQIAQAKYELIKPIVPLACAAFEEFVLNARTFSATEMEVVRQGIEALMAHDIWLGTGATTMEQCIGANLLDRGWKKSYAKEFIKKLNLG